MSATLPRPLPPAPPALAPESGVLAYEPKTKPYAHQQTMLERCWDRTGYALFADMGCGKSKVAIDNICLLREQRGLDRVLIVAPKGVIWNWPLREIPTHMPDRHLKGAIVHTWAGGGSVGEKSALRVLLTQGPELRIFCINVEALATSARASVLVEEFLKAGRTMLLVDESSTCKNPGAERTKFLIRMRKHCVWRRILTGTPVTQSPLDLFSQCAILDDNALGFASYYAFRNHYAVTEQKHFGGRKVEVVVGHRHSDELAQKVARIASVVRKEDALDLPPKVYTTRDVELTPEQTRMYKELKAWATTELSAGRFMTATDVITQLLRLHQLVCGSAVDEQGVASPVPSKRLDTLMEVLSEAPGKAIIWCAYRRNVNDVLSRLQAEGKKAVRYDGETTQPDREKAIQAFQHGDAQYFVATPHTGGYGTTLTAARTVVYFSNSYDLEKRLQSEDRAHRIGQTHSVLYVDLIARGTVEERIIEVLKNKEKLADLIMDGPARIREMMGTI